MAYGKRGAMKRSYGAAVKGARSRRAAETARRNTLMGGPMNRRRKAASRPKKRR